MEWYILDSNFRKLQLIEGYNSMIWTERYNDNGDFELKMPPSSDNRRLYVPETYLACSESTYVMKIETVNDGTDQQDLETLDITGRSLEALVLDNRPAMPAFAGLATTPNWVLTGTPDNIVHTIFNTICVTGALSANDTIPFYTAGTILNTGSIPKDTSTPTITLDPQTVFSAIKQIAQTYGFGFRLVRHDEVNPKIYFETYTGDDRTNIQSVFPAIIFSNDMDDLNVSTKLVSTSNVKNIAYVFAQNGTAIVYGPGTTESTSGFDRRILLVDASDIDTAAGPDLDAALQIKGQQELAGYTKVYQFDGEIPENSQFKYGTDYRLGDIVVEMDDTGFGTRVQVTEQIFASDNQGNRSYPTLTAVSEITAGTWSAQGSKQWSDMATDQVWSNQ